MISRISQTNIFKNKVGKNIGAFWIDQTKYLENWSKKRKGRKLQ